VGFCNIGLRSYIYECLYSLECGIEMTYKTAFKTMFKDLKILLSIEKKHNAKRRLALAMALHPRLGRDSVLGLICKEIMVAVAYSNYTICV
jgi:hypothetical protein